MIFSKNKKNLKNLLNPKFLLEGLVSFFGKYARVFIFIIAIALAVFCIKLWYDTIYKPQWNENQKQEYIKSKSVGIVFNEKGFEHNVTAVTARSEEGKRELGEIKDIFRLKKSSKVVELTPSPVVSVPTNSAVSNDSGSVVVN